MRMSGVLALTALGCTALVFACGGGDGPTPPQRTVNSVVITPPTVATMASFNDQASLSAAARDAAGTTINNATITWETKNTAIVSLSATTGATVTATARGNGSTKVIASSGGKADTVDFTVQQAIATFTLDPATKSLNVGQTQQLSPVAQDARGNAVANPGTVSYASNNNTAATVTAGGLVEAKAEGTATITATLTPAGGGANRTATSAITVTTQSFPTQANVAATANFTFSPATVHIAAGGQVTWTGLAGIHNVHWTGPAPPNGDIPVGQEGGSRTFPNPGTYPYVCQPHQAQGMSGTVVVH